MDHRSVLKKKLSWISLFDTFLVLTPVIVQDFWMLSKKRPEKSSAQGYNLER
jgi:hypothetical protein